MVTVGMWGSSDISVPGAPTAAILWNRKKYFRANFKSFAHISCFSMRIHDWHIKKKIYGWWHFAKLNLLGWMSVKNDLREAIPLPHFMILCTKTFFFIKDSFPYCQHTLYSSQDGWTNIRQSKRPQGIVKLKFKNKMLNPKRIILSDSIQELFGVIAGPIWPSGGSCM